MLCKNQKLDKDFCRPNRWNVPFSSPFGRYPRMARTKPRRSPRRALRKQRPAFVALWVSVRTKSLSPGGLHRVRICAEKQAARFNCQPATDSLPQRTPRSQRRLPPASGRNSDFKRQTGHLPGASQALACHVSLITTALRLSRESLC
jgi:hypothetical protein